MIKMDTWVWDQPHNQVQEPLSWDPDALPLWSGKQNPWSLGAADMDPHPESTHPHFSGICCSGQRDTYIHLSETSPCLFMICFSLCLEMEITVKDTDWQHIVYTGPGSWMAVWSTVSLSLQIQYIHHVRKKHILWNITGLSNCIFYNNIINTYRCKKWRIA